MQLNRLFIDRRYILRENTIRYLYQKTNYFVFDKHYKSVLSQKNEIKYVNMKIISIFVIFLKTNFWVHRFHDYEYPLILFNDIT